MVMINKTTSKACWKFNPHSSLMVLQTALATLQITVENSQIRKGKSSKIMSCNMFFRNRNVPKFGVVMQQFPLSLNPSFRGKHLKIQNINSM